MDISAYYYNNYYNFSTSLPAYEFYPFIENGESGSYEAPSNIYEGPLNVYEEQVNSVEGEDDAFTDPDAIPLPQELTNMFKPLECELCGVSVICHTSAFTHYEGKTHIKNVNAYMKEHYNVYGSLKIKKERFTPVRCDVCNIELTSKVVYQQHFSGKQHLKNLKKKQYSVPTAPSYDISNENGLLKDLPPPPPPPKLSDYVCEVCGISTNTEQQMNFHKNGQKHKRKLAKLNEYKLDNALNSFYINEWPEVNTSVSFIDNPEMDYPLQFNDFSESCNETKNIDEGEIESENQNENVDKENNTECTQEIIPSSLEAKTYEIPTELGIENDKLISSTGVFLRQLSLVPQPINSKEKALEDNDSSKSNVYDGDLSINIEVAQSKGENCKSDTKEKQMSTGSSVATIPANENELEVSKITCSNQIVESKLDGTSSSLKEPTLSLEKPNNKIVTHYNESLTSQSIASLEKKNKQDSKIDQVLTKLAIEEIEKESFNYGKTRDSRKISSEDINQNYTENEQSISKYKYDKAGYRINEDIKNDKNEKENVNDSSRKRYDSNICSYSYKERYFKRNYNYNWNTYDNWNKNNYKMYNNYNSYRNRDDRTDGYWRYYNRNDKNNKRKRDENNGGDEERKRDHRYKEEESKRDSRYDKDEERKRDRRYNKDDRYSSDDERKRDHRYGSDEERKRDRRYDSDEERKRDHRYDKHEERKRNHKYDSDERRKRDHRYDNDEGRRGNRHGTNEGRRHHKSRKEEKKHSRCKKRRSRCRRRKSHSSDSSYGSRSRSKNSSDGDPIKKSKKPENNSIRKIEKKKGCRSSRRNKSDYSDSSSSNSNSSNNHDYRLDKNGMCEKQHRCEKAYYNCPYKHKEPFNQRTEIPRIESIKKEESWNAEAPVLNKEFPVEIKIEKEETAEHKVDPALSAFRTSSGAYYCKYCIVSTKSNELFREHLQTPKHTLLVKFKNKI